MRFSRRQSGIVLVMIVLLILSAVGAAAAPAGEALAGAAPAAAQADKGESLVFFASDGLMQNRVADYVSQGLLPTFADLMKKGAIASDGGLLTQAPPNTGAGWYSLATGAWPAVTGSTNNTFHMNGAAVQQPHGRVRPGRAPGGNAGAGRGARGQEGRAVRMGGGPRRDHRRAHRRLPQLLLGPGRGDELHQPRRQRGLRRVVWPAVRSSGRICGTSAICGRRAG